MNLTAIIIDDNQSSINLLKKLLDEFFGEIQILESFNTVAKSINLIEKEKPDIVFLDAEMPGEDGFTYSNISPNQNLKQFSLQLMKNTQ